MKTYDEIYKEKGLIAWVDLSTYCNARCPQCHRNNKDGLVKTDWLPLIQWDLPTFKKAFPAYTLVNYKKFEFCGTWGDPVMCKDIDKILYYIIENSYASIQINTNGSIRDPDWWWELGVRCGDRLDVWFDIDGIDQEMHELYRQKTDLEKIKENVEAYAATTARASAMCIVFKHNQDYLYEIYDMIRSLGIKGKILFTESNRFYNSPIDKFTTQRGVSKKLEQSTLDSNHPLLNDSIPVRDHKWMKKMNIIRHELDERNAK